LGPLTSRIVVFTRPPIEGEVKTRLAAGVGEAAALALHRAFLTDVLATVRATGVPALVSVAGDPDDPALLALTGELPREAQGGGDLGERMARAFAHAGADGVERLAIVGSDHPTVRPEEILACLEAAGPGTLCLAPAADGGYWCVAGPSGDAVEPAFRDVAWSTPRALEETEARARAAGLTVVRGPAGFDVDRESDLDRLERALSAAPETLAPATRAAMARQRER